MSFTTGCGAAPPVKILEPYVAVTISFRMVSSSFALSLIETDASLPFFSSQATTDVIGARTAPAVPRAPNVHNIFFIIYLPLIVVCL